MVKTYNKLVRDKIPESLEKSGNKCVIATLTDEEYAKKLKEKLLEECNEYLKDENVEELADILEVLYALAKNKVVSLEELDEIRQNKKDKRGAFNDKILLKSVEEV